MLKELTKAFKMFFLFLGLSIYIALLLIGFSSALPTGADVTFVATDNGPTVVPDNRSDLGGTITAITIDAQQKDTAWKAYVGNVTGKFVLRNSNSMSIYEWPSSTSINGEVYITRSASVNFSNGRISCANNSVMVAEQTFFGMSGTATDNINNTFNSTNHTGFLVGGNTITQNTCPAIATWVNNTAQTPSPSAVFQEIALYDTSNFVYAAIINNDQTGFENTTIYDFQAIVAENGSSSTTGTTYYFYVELGP